MGELTLIVGGCRSGKSAFAQEQARGYARVVYVATAEARDREMTERIERHRRERPAHWRTVEAPRGLARALQKIAPPTEIVLIDCLTLYLNNFILNKDERSRSDLWDEELEKLLRVTGEIAPAVIMVSNELGQGIVPADGLSRLYRDLHGAMNQRVAKTAGRVYKMEVGIPLRIK